MSVSSHPHLAAIPSPPANLSFQAKQMKTVFGEITTRFQSKLPQCPVPAMSVVDSKKDDPRWTVEWRYTGPN